MADGSVAVAMQAVLKEVRQQQPDDCLDGRRRPAQNFYRLYHDAGFDAAQMPIAMLTIEEGRYAKSAPNFVQAILPPPPISDHSIATATGNSSTNFHRLFGAAKPISMWSAAHAQVRLFALALKSPGRWIRNVSSTRPSALHLKPRKARSRSIRKRSYLVHATDRKVRRDGGF